MAAISDRPNNEEKAMSFKNIKEMIDISETRLGKITSYVPNWVTVLYTVLASSLSDLLQV
jgi:hypothetical protein